MWHSELSLCSTSEICAPGQYLERSECCLVAAHEYPFPRALLLRQQFSSPPRPWSPRCSELGPIAARAGWRSSPFETNLPSDLRASKHDLPEVPNLAGRHRWIVADIRGYPNEDRIGDSWPLFCRRPDIRAYPSPLACQTLRFADGTEIRGKQGPR